MARSYRTEQRIEGAADEVVRLMIDRETHDALLHSLGTTVEDYREERDGDVVRTVVTTAEKAMQGATTHRATLETTWDLPARRCTWTRRDHTFGDRVRAEGRTVVEPRGDDACAVIETGEIEVEVPLMGKRIERKVVEQMEQLAPRKAAFWTERLRS